MRILYYDCFSGISGDMNLGAMIDIGVDGKYLIDELSKLKITDEYEIKIGKAIKKGIEGTKVDIVLKHNHDHIHQDPIHMHTNDLVHNQSDVEQKHHNDQEHKHLHIGHKHIHENLVHEEHLIHKDNHHSNHKNSSEHHHEHRNLHDIEHIIKSSNLSDNVSRLSLNIFKRIAKAEAKIHGKSIDEIHFHEVGAVDSILDIVGAAICMDYLRVDKIMSSPIELGGGFVRCAHGKFPVPAPATLEILKGVPIKTGIVPFETTTPTGAAILSEIVEEYTNLKSFVVENIGYGIGNRDTEIPNVLRVLLGRI